MLYLTETEYGVSNERGGMYSACYYGAFQDDYGTLIAVNNPPPGVTWSHLHIDN